MLTTTLLQKSKHYGSSSRRWSTSTSSPMNAQVQSAIETILSRPWTNDVDANLEALEPELERAKSLLDDEARARASNNASSVMDTAAHDLHLLFLVREMVPACSILSEHASDLLREKMDQVGALGNDTSPHDPELEEQCETLLHTYEAMVTRVRAARDEAVTNRMDRMAIWDRALGKMDEELGSHVLQVRQSVSIERFSEYFGPIATNQMIPRDEPVSKHP